MSKPQIQARIIFFSTLIVVVFGALSIASILNPVPLNHEKVTRKPASVATKLVTISDITPEKHLMPTIKYDCKNKYHKSVLVSEHTHQISISGHRCPEDSKNYEFTKVTNTTNHHQATVFKISKVKFKSDFIHIDPGENIITIEELSPHGDKKSSQIKIIKPKVLTQ